jgi:hypothetical protein
MMPHAGAAADAERAPSAKGTEPMDSRTRLLARIGDINNFDLLRPVVSLEEFFEGNEDPGSIGYNLPDPPTPQEFYALLLGLRAHPEITDVLVEVKDLEDPDGWPSADTIWFVTSMTDEELARLFEERIRPDAWPDYPPQYPIEPIRCPPGTHAIAAWYD